MKWISAHRYGIWAFLVGVAFIPHLMSAAVVGRWIVIAVGVPLVARIEFKFPFAIQFSLAMGFAWSAASVLFTPDHLDGMLQLLFMLILIGVMGAASQIETLDDAMTGLCLGVGASAIFCFAQLIGDPLVEQSKLVEGQYAGLFYNSAVLTELAAVLMVWAAVKQKWLLAVITIIPLAINLSRIAVLAAAIALIWAYWPKSWKWRTVLLIAVIVVAGGAIIHSSMQNHKIGSAALRISHWLEAGMEITFSGRGIGWFRTAHLNTDEMAHSDIIQAFVELGVGALCFALIPVYAFVRGEQHRAERAAFIVICIELAISFPLHVPASAFVAALLAGFLVSRGDSLRLFRPESRDYYGPYCQRYAADSGDAFGRGGSGSFVLPVRCEDQTVSTLGPARSWKEAG